MKQALFSVGFIIIFLQGCAVTEKLFNVPSPSYEQNFVSYQYGYIDDARVRIEAADGSFTMAGEQFTPPFETPAMWQVMKTPLFEPVYQYSDSYLGWRANSTELIDSYNQALGLGAKRVIIHHPASATPLHGVLMLNKRFNDTDSPEARSFYIRIPNTFVSNAKSGNTNVVFATAPADIDGPILIDFKPYIWILWLSDTPF